MQRGTTGSRHTRAGVAAEFKAQAATATGLRRRLRGRRRTLQGRPGASGRLNIERRVWAVKRRKRWRRSHDRKRKRGFAIFWCLNNLTRTRQLSLRTPGPEERTENLLSGLSSVPATASLCHSSASPARTHYGPRNAWQTSWVCSRPVTIDMPMTLPLIAFFAAACHAR